MSANDERPQTRTFAGESVENDPTALTRRDLLQIAGGTVCMGIVAETGIAAAEGEPASTSGTTLRVQLTVNGRVQALELDPRQSLLDVLREELDLTGTKKGCNQGACGACTILVDGKRIVSCLALAASYDGAEIVTIEGLAEGDRLHPLQAAFIEHEGLQCGFCTPGQIMSGVACIAEGHAGSVEDIRFWMSGNICRCAAYPGIVAAVSQAAQEV